MSGGPVSNADLAGCRAGTQRLRRSVTDGAAPLPGVSGHEPAETAER